MLQHVIPVGLFHRTFDGRYYPVTLLPQKLLATYRPGEAIHCATNQRREEGFPTREAAIEFIERQPGWVWIDSVWEWHASWTPAGAGRKFTPEEWQALVPKTPLHTPDQVAAVLAEDTLREMVDDEARGFRAAAFQASKEIARQRVASGAAAPARRTAMGIILNGKTEQWHPVLFKRVGETDRGETLFRLDCFADSRTGFATKADAIGEITSGVPLGWRWTERAWQWSGNPSTPPALTIQLTPEEMIAYDLNEPPAPTEPRVYARRPTADDLQPLTGAELATPAETPVFSGADPVDGRLDLPDWDALDRMAKAILATSRDPLARNLAAKVSNLLAFENLRTVPMHPKHGRRGDWIGTHTGTHFWTLDPRVDEVQLHDIVWALPHINRYGGHTERPYSVGEHTLLVERIVRFLAKGATVEVPHADGEGCVLVPVEFPTLSHAETEEEALDALLHDGGEVYLTDVCRPVKRFLPVYGTVEYNLLLVIGAKFGRGKRLAVPSKLLQFADWVACSYEVKALCGNPQDWNLPPLMPGFSPAYDLDTVAPPSPQQVRTWLRERFSVVRAAVQAYRALRGGRDDA